MFSRLLSFDLRLRLRQPSFLMLALASIAYGITLSVQDIGEGLSMLALNAPYRQTYFLALCSSLACFAALIFGTQDLLRDETHGFSELIGARAPLARGASRWLTVQIAVLAVLSLIGLALTLGFALPRADRDALLPLQLAPALGAWLLFVIPNCLISGSLLLYVTLRWRRTGISFSAALLLFSIASGLLIASGAPLFGPSIMRSADSLAWMALLDPFGLVAFFAQTQFLSPAEKQAPLPWPDALLLGNRLIWLAVAALLSWIGLRRLAHEPALCPASRGRSHSGRSGDSPVVSKEQSVTADSTAAAWRWATLCRAQWPRLWAVLKRELATLYGGWSVRLLLALWWLQVVVGVLMTIGTFSAGLSAGRYPSTALLISYCAENLAGFGAAMLLLCSVQLMWADQRHRMDSLIDACDVASHAIYGARMIALCSLPMLMIVLLVATAAGYQASVGYTRFEWSQYASVFWYFGLPLALQAVALLLVQALWQRSRWANPYTALIVGAGYLLLSAVCLPGQLAEYPALQLNQFPRLLRQYSELAGYGLLGERFAALALHWGVVGVCLALLSVLLWPRGAWRWSAALRGRSARRLLTLCLVLCAASAWHLHNQLPTRHDYLGDQALLDDRARYERLHSTFRRKPVAQISRSLTQLAIHPEQQRLEVEAENTLHNRNQVPLETVLISSRWPLTSLKLEGADLIDQSSGLQWHSYRFHLRRPLAPGETSTLRYSLAHRSDRFAIDPALVTNGSYFHQGKIEPALGYVEALEIQDPTQREQRGLPPRAALEEDLAHGSGDARLIAEKRQFEAILSTAGDQIAVSAGELIGQWQREGRRFFHYRSVEPIYPLVGYFSARYAKLSYEHEGIPIEFYVHPDQQRNVETMLRAVRTTLEYCRRWFGDYPYRQLRLVQVPRYHGFGGRASAGVIALNERLFEENVDSAALVSNVLRNTIHEVAHQWWGEKLMPKIAPGHQFLNESLAKYVEAVLIGELQGRRAQTWLGDYNRRRYFAGRAHRSEPEPPLIAADQAYLTYGKGPVVLLGLRALLGEERLNIALHRFMQRHRENMSATADDLVAELSREASAAEATSIQRWLGTVSEYRLALHHAQLSRQLDGRYVAEIELSAERLVDGAVAPERAAAEATIPLVLLESDPRAGAATPLAQRGVEVRRGLQRIRMFSDQRPRFVVIDPDRTRLELDLEDNWLQVEPVRH
ncbi:M1 family aminopeptidase [Pseudomarimonas arenosa]|uniref:Peptidase M1 membrane alanine aminopeptidase domain-containing protein n=1 Tax=Pseudomarimonas arenosa TaxID=2774145 RepID=A0AAW3ZNZ3_9GAMM|nr:M1 family aminopeptidase [Pseudomarimonas arenosa]MBD8526887.1 hypothetical protein [Pseudomarimonas arenosa]